MKRVEHIIDFILGSDRKVVLRKIYYKPKKSKLIFGFVFSFFFLFILIFVMGFRWNLLYLLLFIGDFSILFYYGVNLFTSRGIWLPKYVEEKEEDKRYVKR